MLINNFSESRGFVELKREWLALYLLLQLLRKWKIKNMCCVV